MPRKRRRCTKPSLFCNVCKYLESIGGLGDYNKCKKIRSDAKKRGEDIICKGHCADKDIVVFSPDENMKRPVRHKKSVHRTGSGLSLSATGRKSQFCTLSLRKKNAQITRRTRDYRLRLGESNALQIHQPQKVSQILIDTRTLSFFCTRLRFIWYSLFVFL